MDLGRIDELRSNRWTHCEESFEVPDEDLIEILEMVRAYLIRKSIQDKYAGSMKFTTHL